MSERTRCYVYTADDPGNVLFQLPSLSRRMDEGDTFKVTSAGGQSITYKVEKVDYKLRQRTVAVGEGNNTKVSWADSSVGYGVSIVP